LCTRFRHRKRCLTPARRYTQSRWAYP
jgi:hypothetical protein